MKINNPLKLIISIAICELAGLLGTIFTVSAIPTWYAGLDKPFLNPPSWLFGPAWTTLYFLMGVALWLVWTGSSKGKKRAIWLFAVQLALNAIWSPVFFGAHSIGGALVVIVILWATIAVTISSFSKVSKKAAWLLVPYVAWVTFALYLNFALWILN